jgi:hypothetical protein
MAWLPFPFPSCPICAESWPRSRHKNCVNWGSFEVDPDRAWVRCDGCHEEASVWGLVFSCTCGNDFQSHEVQRALDDVLATADLFELLVKANMREVQMARSMGENSLRSWIAGAAERIGGYFGGLLGSLAGKLAAYLFKRI